MPRIAEDAAGEPGLLDLAGLHDHQLVGPVAGHGEVVRDEQHADAAVLPQLVDEVQDRLLHRHVQRTGGLVGDDEVRFGGQRGGDEGPLPHTAGELVRILVITQLGIIDTHGIQELDDGCPTFLFAGVAERLAVNAQHLANRFADGLHGVQRGAGVLRDEPDPQPADVPPLLLRDAVQVLAVELDFSGRRRVGRQ